MQLPVLSGTIDRRMLINFRADPSVVANLLPPPFTPAIYRGYAMVGICLIRLKKVRIKGLPEFLGFGSENAAHRIAVNWTVSGAQHSGVYIPRRDTSSIFNSLAGGRVFPGVHFHSRFATREEKGIYELDMFNKDGTNISVWAFLSERYNPDSIFDNLQAVSDFFEQGAVGYSPASAHYDGIKLNLSNWAVKSLSVERVESTYFSDPLVFPNGSIAFDNALLMEHIEHEWHAMDNIYRC
ncbi:DUF2071 domain-containing protein [Flavihumibacter sp. CACIAM 22H1]|uniref:DUF2071 domain-containing protein n=1 Tax=Flavihumibacter sp. CACIAM 22H1 TaxID=1812911 RepID=UPI0007A9067F|nr:DUF2071 domain-containing protein [Flavihumibacter sp. CACIAM 22H1]KYP13543.1 MAG: hypothetical protein A1D16_17435 [Flavihumibacter sp. CACIAM 22H1]